MVNCPIIIDPERDDFRSLSEHILSCAKARGFYAEQDPFGNVLVRKPASGRPEGCCLLHGYTLPAASIMAAVLQDTSHALPELEILFTKRDKNDRTSAWDFDMSKLKSKHMINLDAPGEEAIVSSCSGFARLQFETTIHHVEPAANAIPVNVRIFGLTGGNSATEIQKGNANAIKLMGEFLFDWYNFSIDTQLVGIWSDALTNTIPNECYAKLWIRQDLRENLDRGAWWFGEDLSKRFPHSDPYAEIQVTYPMIDRSDRTWSPMSVDETGRILSFLNLCPVGMINRRQDHFDEVETSCNLHKVDTLEDRWNLSATVRSFDDDQKDALRDKYELLAELNRIDFISIGDFPCWNHKNVSDLQRRYEEAYQSCLGKTVSVIGLHEEQEPILFVRAIPELEAISIGVNHKDGWPDEESAQRILTVLYSLLEGRTA